MHRAVFLLLGIAQDTHADAAAGKWIFRFAGRAGGKPLGQVGRQAWRACADRNPGVPGVPCRLKDKSAYLRTYTCNQVMPVRSIGAIDLWVRGYFDIVDSRMLEQ